MSFFKSAAKFGVDTVASKVLPGAGNLRSGANAAYKAEALERVLQEEFHEDMSTGYDGSEIKPDQLVKAIKYAIGKKATKEGAS